jgi:hypothetical protein
MTEIFFYDPYSQETHPDYWDCECSDDYIHSKKEGYCILCGAIREDQPDSHISELYDMHYKNIKERHEQRRDIMNKEGFIKILKYGRKTLSGRKRFRDSWYDRKSNTINKKERASCCYAKFFNPLHDNSEDIIEHIASDEHILKIVERVGYEDKRLVNEVRYYSGKILNQERRKNEPF